VATFLKAPVAIATLNRVFDGTFPITTLPIPDCQTTCEEGEGDLFQTALVYPFNRLIVGTSITSDDDDVTYGYQGQNSGTRIELYFSPPETISEWGFAAEVFMVDDPDSAVVTLQHFDEGWSSLQQWTIEGIPAATWTDILQDGIEIELSPAIAYRMLFERPGFNLYARYRKIIGSSTLF
jgi:hypothetical protein